MTENPKHSPLPPSFSTSRRWKIGLDVAVRTLLVVAVIVMANYLGSLFSRPIYLSSQTRIHLAPRTVSILQTLTNRVDVTVYYDKQDGMFSTVMDLLKEYHRLDPRINIKVVDYIRDPGEAAKIQQKYHLAGQVTNPNSPPDKNLIIFDCVGANPPRYKVAPGKALVQYGPDGMTKDRKIEFRPMAFNGEKMFTSMLLAVTNPKPFTAYFLQGDGEPSPADSGDTGYLKFTEVLQENYIRVLPLSLSGNQDIPADCDLLIIVGPETAFSNSELSKIDNYLTQGGRLLALFGYSSISHPTGLEDLLAQWGVNVGYDIVRDRTDTYTGNDVIVQNFNSHPIVNPLVQSKLEMWLPRPVGPIVSANPPANAPTVTELAVSSPNSVLYSQRGALPRAYPLMVAVEQTGVKGISPANGDTRLVVVGDSLFLNNQVIDGAENRDFAGYAVNWLLDRPLLLNGIGPSPVIEFRLLITQSQMREIRWLMLGALPGALLVMGTLVWLQRRK